MQSYTVVGIWYEDDPVVAGVLDGDCTVVDDDPYDDRFQGRWATSVEASSPAEAEAAAIIAMGAAL